MLLMKVLIALIILLVLHCGAAFATDMVFRHYTIEDGLPNSNVFRLLQDSRGFMWVGTESGVCRFNGKDFEKFEPYRALRGKQILGLFENQDGEIFVNSYDGRIHVFEHDSGFRDYTAGTDSLTEACTEMVQDRQGKLWMILRPYANIIDETSVQDFHLGDYFDRYDPAARKPQIHDLTRSLEGGVYVATEDGLFYYLDGEVTSLEGTEGIAVHSIQEIESGTLFAGCYGSILKIADNKVVQQLFHPSLVNRKVQEIVLQAENHFWLAGEAFGPFMLTLTPAAENAQAGNTAFKHTETQQFAAPLHAHIDTSMQFDKIQINDIVVDRRGETWFATFGSGIIFLSGKSSQNFTVDDGLVSGYVKDIVEHPQGTILAASIHGMSQIDLNSNSMRRIPLHLEGERLQPIDWIEALALDSANQIWVSVKPNRIVQYDGKTTLFDTYGLYFDAERKKSIFGTTDWLLEQGVPVQGGTSPNLLYTDHDGTVLGVQWKGLFKILRHGAIELFPDSQISEQRVFSVNRDAEGVLWIGTDFGLFYSADDVNVARFGYEDGLPSENVRAIEFDNQDRVWIATDLGVAVYDGSAWTVYNEQSGLSSSLCTSLAKDENGAMWVGTKNGLNCILDGKITHVNKRRGIVSDEVLTLVLDSEQHLWLGTGAGISRILPAQFSTGERPAPPTYITKILTQFETYSTPQHVILPYDSSDVTINYAALEYEFPEGVQFQYKLENADEDWRLTTDWHKNYTNLSPGEYVFRVRSRIDNSAWDETNANFQLTITPPIWQQLEYQLLALLVGMIFAGGIVLAFTRARQARRDEKNSWMLSIAELQQQALNLTVNPHFLFNALTSIQHYFNSDQTISRANIYLSKFSKLVRLVLDDSQYDQISLSDELHRLGLYFELEKMRLGKNFEWFVTTDLTHDAEEVKIPVMIIQPYVENAIWHGIYPLNGEGEVRVHIWNESEDLLRVRISDNGLGVAQSRQVKKVNGRTHKSRGMQITQQRIDLHVQTGKGKIAVDISQLDPDNLERPGTVVDVSIGI